MPPKYAFGYHQGCYGYYNRGILLNVAHAFRAAQIPIDGLHIDVDFQNNYRTFTSSPEKFPNPKGMFDDLHAMGYKCSTNITGIITANPLDEKGQRNTPYPARDAFVQITADNQIVVRPNVTPPFIYDTRASGGESPDLFIANESYGDDDTDLYPDGFNPYPYPTPLYPQGQEALGTYGFYCDMARPDVQKWWGQQYEYLLEIGIDMIWQDMTDPAVVPNFDNDTPDKTLPLDLMMYDAVTGQYQPSAKIHNAFAINLIQSTFEGLTALKASPALCGAYNQNKRNFIIARGGYAGVQRYAGIWTGDSASSWDFLQINIPEVLGVGLSGLPISGCDIGGFANGSGSRGSGITDYELYTRWMNLGAFLPWYRNHYDGYTKLFQEPYRYGEPVPTNCRKYIELRYRLIQLFYDAMYENTVNGLPICRALFVNESDPAVFSHADDQFFVGADLLVAPIVGQGQLYRDVYLPAGSQWYVLNDNTYPLGAPTPGGTTQNWYAPLGLVPLYVREGAIVPFRELEQYVGQLAQNPITFNIYPGKDSTYTLYQDDQTTTANVEQSAYRVTEVSHQGIPGGQRVSFVRSHDGFTPSEPFFYVAFLGTRAPSSVQLGGVALPDRGSPEGLNGSSANGYYFNPSIATTYVKVFDSAPTLELSVVW
jgi:alpha-glucosidase